MSKHLADGQANYVSRARQETCGRRLTRLLSAKKCARCWQGLTVGARTRDQQVEHFLSLLDRFSVGRAMRVADQTVCLPLGETHDVDLIVVRPLNGQRVAQLLIQHCVPRVASRIYHGAANPRIGLP